MKRNASLAHDQHSKVSLVKSGMSLTMAVNKNGIPFKEPPATPKVPMGTPPWKAPPQQIGSNPQPKDGSGA